MLEVIISNYLLLQSYDFLLLHLVTLISNKNLSFQMRNNCFRVRINGFSWTKKPPIHRGIDGERKAS